MGETRNGKDTREKRSQCLFLGAKLCIMGASCLEGTVETIWTRPMAQWLNLRTLIDPRMVN